MKRTLLMLTLLLLGGGIMAEEVEFTAKAPNVVRHGQQFRLTFTVNTQADDFQPPNIEHFSVLAGPSTSSSTNVSIINGKMTRQFQLSYTFILRADEMGEFTIPSARVEVDGKQYESNPLTIEVIDQKQTQGSSGQAATSSDSDQPAETVQATGDELFVRVLVNKNSVYREEPLVATIKLYSKLSVSGLENVKFPAFEGFYKQEIETPTLRQLDKENINGEIYGTGVLKKYLLFPQKSGKLTIEPFQVDCIVQKKVQSQSQSLFDDFFGSYRNVRMPVKTDPVSVRVKELPKGQPAEFSGGVGSFDISASVDKNQVAANEGITLTLKISGKGNLKVLSPPQINFSPDLEVYDPKINNDISVSESGAKGTKTVEYLVIPRHAGEYRIPSATLSYFDLNRQTYTKVQTKPLILQVEQGKGDTTGGVQRSYSRKDVSIIGSDIRYIKTDQFDLEDKNEFLFGSTPFYLVYISGIVLFAGIFLVRRRKEKENADIALMKNRKANKFARKRLKEASRYLDQGQKDSFYEETLKALWGYLGDKLDIPVAELSRDKAREKLESRNIPEEMIERFMKLIDNCEYARYAPSTDEERMDRLYQDAITIISTLHQKLK